VWWGGGGGDQVLGNGASCHVSSACPTITRTRAHAPPAPHPQLGYKRVFLHPSSALFGAANFEQQQRFLVFHSRQQQANTDRIYLRDVTAVSPLALLLFGGEVSINHDRGSVTVDSQITFDAPGRVAVLVRELRAECDSLLRAKIEEPALEIRSHPVLLAIVNLLSNE